MLIKSNHNQSPSLVRACARVFVCIAAAYDCTRTVHAYVYTGHGKIFTLQIGFSLSSVCIFNTENVLFVWLAREPHRDHHKLSRTWSFSVSTIKRLRSMCKYASDPSFSVCF